MPWRLSGKAAVLSGAAMTQGSSLSASVASGPLAMALLIMCWKYQNKPHEYSEDYNKNKQKKALR